MTVAAAAPAQGAGRGLEVLEAMVGYVKHFFGCRHCAVHFVGMYDKFSFNVSTNDDAVLWLWQAHNQVNWRIRHDISADPQAPKIQFPSAEMCQDCRDNDGGVWRQDRVLSFLKDYYSFSDITNSGVSMTENVFVFGLLPSIFTAVSLIRYDLIRLSF